MEKIIRSKRVVTPLITGPASVHISGGKVAALREWDDIGAGVPLDDFGHLVVMPGNVDAHVHVNEPGRTEWEGFETATRAAIAGGVTTIVDMPLNSIPPTTTLAGLEEKLKAAEGRVSSDAAFWGGVIPGNTSELERLIGHGVCGFKCFLIHSGVDEFPHVTADDLREAMPEIERLGSVLLVHAELPGPIEAAAASTSKSDPHLYDTFLNSRPRESENEAIEMMVRLCRETGCRLHIVHHSSSDALPMLRNAKAAGLPITVETCPHYLTFCAEEIPDRATQFKCCPPVRERENREKLWEAVADGTIDMIVSDHSPCTPELKLQQSGDFMDAWGGIAALQFGLPVMWTTMRARGFEIRDLTRLMSAGPARLAGIADRKGVIAAGSDADLVIWDPDRTFKVEPSMIEHRHKLTPYDSMELSGVVDTVFLRGERVYADGAFKGGPQGQLIFQNKRSDNK